MTLKYVLHTWAGWPLQHQIIDGPACQGVLVWGEGMPGGYAGCMPATTCSSLTFVPLDTCVCNVEGCGLIADGAKPARQITNRRSTWTAACLRGAAGPW